MSGMRIIGLTGSIGMGKSTTVKLFAEQGVPVYDADAAVHQLYEREAVAPLEAAFPGSTENGRVVRERLAAQVLGKPEALKRLESIVHPLLGAQRNAFLAEAERSGAKVAVLDVPLLFETGGDKRVDAIVVVSAPEHMQRERVLARENMTLEKLDAILARQMPDADKRARADFVVDTSNGIEPVRARVKEIIAEVAKMPLRRS
jgi:dephospho-CoA kinase